MELFDLLTLEV